MVRTSKARLLAVVPEILCYMALVDVVPELVGRLRCDDTAMDALPKVHQQVVERVLWLHENERTVLGHP